MLLPIQVGAKALALCTYCTGVFCLWIPSLSSLVYSFTSNTKWKLTALGLTQRNVLLWSAMVVAVCRFRRSVTQLEQLVLIQWYTIPVAHCTCMYVQYVVWRLTGSESHDRKSLCHESLFRQGLLLSALKTRCPCSVTFGCIVTTHYLPLSRSQCVYKVHCTNWLWRLW